MVVVISIPLTLLGYNELLDNWSDSLSKILTPVCMILGMILGYPLLKKKLAESYVEKQFDIMVNANRAIRAKCIQLQDKYVSEQCSTKLMLEYVSEAKNDILELKQIAIDATPDVYRYVNLIYQSLKNMESYCKAYGEAFRSYYQEELSTWLNEHLHKTYDYSRTIGVLPSGTTRSKRRLNKRLSKFVTDNSYVEIDDLNHTIGYYHHSSMLVIFYGKNNALLSKNHLYLYSSCFEAAPSPSPFARLMYNSCIYFPPLLKSNKKILLHYGELYLIGYSRITTGSIDGEIEETYYICTYANLDNVSFVEGTIHDLDSLKQYSDGYLNIEFPLNNITNLKKNMEFIQFRISEKEAFKRYHEHAYRLQCKLKEELEK